MPTANAEGGRAELKVRDWVASWVERAAMALYRLYLGIADVMSTAPGADVPVLKMTASARRSF